MKKTITMLVFLLAGLLAAQQRPQTYTGIVTDTMCDANHAHMGITPDEKCVRECVRTSNGKFKYAL